MGESPFAEICHAKKRAFLSAFAECGNKSRAAEMAGIVKQTIYTRQWREDREFQVALESAHVMAADRLEEEAHRRAVDGWEEPVGWYKGVAGGTVRRYSDNLLMFLLKGARPERYRERYDVRGTLAHLDLRRLPDDLIERLAKGESPLTVLAPLLQAGELPALGPGKENEAGE